MIAYITGLAEPECRQDVHSAAMQQLFRIFSDMHVNTPYRSSSEPATGSPWSPAPQGPSPGEMTLAEGTVIPRQARHSTSSSARPPKWGGNQLVIISAYWGAALPTQQISRGFLISGGILALILVIALFVMRSPTRPVRRRPGAGR